MFRKTLALKSVPVVSAQDLLIFVAYGEHRVGVAVVWETFLSRLDAVWCFPGYV